MLIAIISDSHDNIYNIEKFLNWCEKNSIEMIIHCGDLAAPAVLKKEFSLKFKGPFHFVHGNVADRELNEEFAQELENVTCHGDKGELEISSPPFEGGVRGGSGGEKKEVTFKTPPNLPLESGGVIKIAFCHFPEVAKELALSGEYNLVFYGHTHKPWMETLENGCQLINPGTLAGMFNKATFAVYDSLTKNLELVLVEKINTDVAVGG